MNIVYYIRDGAAEKINSITENLKTAKMGANPIWNVECHNNVCFGI